MKNRARRSARLALACLAVTFAAGCQTNPATGRRILSTMSLSDEISLGAQAAPQFTQEFGGEVTDAELRTYVTGIGSRLATKTEGPFPDIPWTFTLLNSDVVNAFALPGGQVFVSRGLARRLTNEAQLAGVMGHEVGHVTAQHGSQRIAQQTLFNVGMTVAAVVVSQSKDEDVRRVGTLGVPALQIGGNLVLLKYGRDEELEADRLGVRYMTALGYDPLGQYQVMELLNSLSQGQRQPEILSTHPDPARRMQQVRQMLAGEYAFTQGDPAYQLREGEFRTRFLARLAALPPAPDAVAVAAREGTLGVGSPLLWCAHCQAERDAR